MARETTMPTVDEYGYEKHPSWGRIGVNRVSYTGEGAHLFDSDITHRHGIVVRLETARRKRDLNRDWIMEDQEFVEVAMSEAQWAAFVSSIGGGPVPCTILRREDDHRVPEAPYSPRLAESINEVRGAARKGIEEVQAALDEYKAHKTVKNLRSLEYTIANLPSNMAFAGDSLTEHVEGVVTKAQADLEAIVQNHADRLGIEAADLGAPQLTSGEED